MASFRVILAFLVYITSEVVYYTAASSSSSSSSTTPVEDGSFSCSGKVIGGYYADIQDNCQMFHVCTIGEKGEIRDIVFRCLNGTVFDQETRVCERQEEVDCSKTESFFYLNNELYGPGIIPAMEPVEPLPPSSTQQQVLDPSDALMGVSASEQESLSADESSNYDSSSSSDTPPPSTPHPNTTMMTRPPPATKTSPITLPPSIPPEDTRPPDNEDPHFSEFDDSSHPSDIFKTLAKRPPFTVTRTASSTSVSASARVHIQTPISRFSLSQGFDREQASLPAPHLRPSLLKLAAAKSEASRRSRRVRRSSSFSLPNLFFSNSDQNVTISPLTLLPHILTAPKNLSHESSSDQLLTNDQLRSYFLEHRYRGAQVHGDLQQTLTHKDNQTPNRPKSDMDYQTCVGVQDASLQTDVRNNCKTYRVCLPAFPPQMMESSFICIDDGFSFDYTQGKCSRDAQCHSSSTLFPLRDEKKKLSVLDPLRFCTLVSEGSFILDTLSDCEQFLQCPFEGNKIIAVKRCSSGALFSQKHGSCVEASQVDCKRDTYSLLRQLSKIEHLLSEIPESLSSETKNVHINQVFDGKFVDAKRFKRSLVFENRNPHREATNGALTNVAGVISDHAAVIDARSSGTGLDGKVTFPEFSRNFDERLNPVTAKPAEKNGFLNNFGVISDKDFADSTSHSHPSPIFNKDEVDPEEVRPQTSLAFNQTNLNGTVIEVSEIASPHKHGKVTITSVVPKFVRQNGNNGKKHRTSTEDTKEKVNGSKINLVGGVHHPFSPTNKGFELEPTNVEVDATTVKTSQRSEPELKTETENTTNSADKVEETTIIVRDAQLEDQTNLPETLEAFTEEVIIATTMEEVVETTIKTSTTTSPTTTSTTTSTTTVTSTPETRSEAPVTQATTNFTCKNKELEQFYPDIETGCKNFHYCSPGFKEDEILDLSFVCSGDTRFDILTKKCQDINTVECSADSLSAGSTTISSSTTESTTTTTIATSTTTTTPVVTTTSSSSTESTSTTLAPTTTMEPEIEDNFSTTESTEDEMTTLSETLDETDSPSARSDLVNSEAVVLESSSVDTRLNEPTSSIESQTSPSTEKSTPFATDYDTITDSFTESSSMSESLDTLRVDTETPTVLDELVDEIFESLTESSPTMEVDSLVSEMDTKELDTVAPSAGSEPEKTTSLQKLK